MTDETEQQKREREVLDAVRQLSAGDISQYLSAKGSKPQCPCCGQNNWNVTSPQTEGVVSLAIVPVANLGSVLVGGAAIPVVVMMCQHCGFIRQHAAMLVAEWVLSNSRRA